MPLGLRMLMKVSSHQVRCFSYNIQTNVLKKSLVALDPIKYLSCSDELVHIVGEWILMGYDAIDVANSKLRVLLSRLLSIDVIVGNVGSLGEHEVAERS